MIRVYLDYNATAPVRAEAIEAMGRAIQAGGNPSSPDAPRARWSRTPAGRSPP
ncbi:MAG: hypothetical protein WDA06_13760 [Phenylobacterium sp.]